MVVFIFVVLFVILIFIVISTVFFVKRKVYEKEYIEIKKLNHSLFNFSDAGIIIFKSDLSVDSVNKTMEKISGYSAEEIAQGEWSKFIDKNFLQKMTRQRITSEKTKEDFTKQFEQEITAKDGSGKEVLVKTIVLPQTRRAIVYMFEITKIRLLELRLENSYVRYRSTLNEMQAAIISLNKDYDVIFMNKCTAEMLGYDFDSLSKKRMNFKDINIPYFWEKVELKLRLLALKNRIFKEEIELIRADKTAFMAEVTFSVITLPDGKNEFIGVVKDISLIKDNQAKLFELEKGVGMGEYFLGVSRELGEKFHTGYSTLQNIKERMGNEYQKDFDRIFDAFKDVDNVIKSLEIFTMDSMPKKIYYNINDSVVLVVSLMKHIYYMYNVELSVKLAENLPHVFADKVQLEQVLVNLLNNAYDAVDKETGKILITTEVLNKKLLLKVKDNGEGVKKSDLEKIFYPFFTTKKSKKSSGLGLSFSYDIVRMHDGEIKVDSEYGRGSCFIVELPLHGEVSETEEKIDSTKLLDKKGKVLVVDDDEMITDLVKSILEEEGFFVKAAKDGEEALKRIEANDYDIILLDFRMPNMNGFQFYEWLKDNRHEYIDKLVFFSGDTHSEDVEHFLQLTGKKCVSKPFNMQEFIAIVNETLMASQKGKGDA